MNDTYLLDPDLLSLDPADNVTLQHSIRVAVIQTLCDFNETSGLANTTSCKAPYAELIARLDKMDLEGAIAGNLTVLDDDVRRREVRAMKLTDFSVYLDMALPGWQEANAPPAADYGDGDGSGGGGGGGFDLKCTPSVLCEHLPPGTPCLAPALTSGGEARAGMCYNTTAAKDPCEGVVGVCIKREKITTYNLWCPPGLQSQDCRTQCFITLFKGKQAREMPVQVLVYDAKGGVRDEPTHGGNARHVIG